MKSTSTLKLFFVSSLIVGLLISATAKENAPVAAATPKKDATLYLTNKDGEKVFSYNNTASLFVKLVATALNLDANARDIAAVTVMSDMEPEGEVLMLQETEKNSGIFMGELKFKESPMPFKNSKFLEVASGDKITALYSIGKDAKGVEERTFDNAYYKGPDWVFQNTGESHIILIHPEIKITIKGKPAEPGIFISVFYEKKEGDKVVLENGGGTGRGIAPGGVRWNGKVTTVAAWGAQSGKSNGFATDETFKWKIWNPEDGKVYDAVATYMSDDTHITHTDKYANNGISGIIKLEVK